MVGRNLDGAGKNTHLQRPDLRHFANESQTPFVIWLLPDVSPMIGSAVCICFASSKCVLVEYLFWLARQYPRRLSPPNQLHCWSQHRGGGPRGRFSHSWPSLGSSQHTLDTGKLLTLQCCDQFTMTIIQGIHRTALWTVLFPSSILCTAPYTVHIVVLYRAAVHSDPMTR